MHFEPKGLRALALALLLGASPEPAAHAQAREEPPANTPVRLDGAALGAGSLREAKERTERLGFVWSDPGPTDWTRLGAIRLKSGALAWTLDAGEPFALLWTRALRPYLSWRTYRRGLPAPVGLGDDPRAAQPNHAVGVVAVIGLVGALDDAVKNVEQQEPFRSGHGAMRFQRPFRIADLGASAADAPVPGGGFVRLIAPSDPAARCASWVTGGPGRWVGLVLESDDLEATAAFYDAKHVPYRRIERDVPSIQLDPEDTGGVLIEFVGRGWRPHA